jgi:outer membrane protease
MDAEPEQWKDYSAGINLGWKINKRLGVFIEGEYSKMWDSELYNTSFGLNYTLK